MRTTFHFDVKKTRYTLMAVGLLFLIFALGGHVAQVMGEIVYEQATLGYIPLSNVYQVKTVYKQLTEDNAVSLSPEHIEKKRDLLIAEKKDFLFADLDEMALTVYRAGMFAAVFPILAKGKKDTFFETPNGAYTIRSKEVNHFSSIGSVWMPWSMHFYGNYFVHGWPYYPNGKKVSAAFSGGCIRLSTEDAKKLYTMAVANMPFLAYSRNTEEFLGAKDFLYFKKVAGESMSRLPAPLSAESILAADFETGQILYEKESNTPHPIASLAKIMTALVAVENINRFKPLAMTKSAAGAPESSSGIPAGEVFEAEEYLYPLLIASANDVAALLQESAGNFVSSMNEKARAIGMENTRFRDASGISEFNFSTAKDMFILLRFAYTSKQPIFSILGTKEHSAASESGKIYRWKSHAWPAGDRQFVAGKSGNTIVAGETFAGVFRIKVSEFEERQIAIIVLRSLNRETDIRVLKEYLADNFFYGTAALVRNRKERPLVVEQDAAIFQAIPPLWITKIKK